MERNFSKLLLQPLVCKYCVSESLKFRKCLYRSKYDAFEIIATANLPVSYLNNKIPYKYIVYSGYSGVWEYIHDLPARGIFNRCLELSQSSSSGNK